MQRPSAMWHMLQSGALLGLIFGVFFNFIGITVMSLLAGADLLNLLSITLGCLWGGFFGLVYGICLGFIDGLALAFLFRKLYLPVNPQRIHAKHFWAYSSIAILSYSGAYFLTLTIINIINWDFIRNIDFFGILLMQPALLATSAALWATKAYLVGVLALNEKLAPLDKAKGKPKLDY